MKFKTHPQTVLFQIFLIFLYLIPLSIAGPALDLVAEKVGSILAEKFKEKLGDLLAKRPCNCQLVMNPPPMPWYHQPPKHHKRHKASREQL